MTRERQALGAGGEDAAARWLERSGLRILARRFRLRMGEIDVVAEDEDGTIVFVEVKARRGLRFGRPAEAVTAVKRRRLARVAAAFLARCGLSGRRSRFDVVEILPDGAGGLEVRHIPDAFRLWDRP